MEAPRWYVAGHGPILVRARQPCSFLGVHRLLVDISGRRVIVGSTGGRKHYPAKALPGRGGWRTTTSPGRASNLVLGNLAYQKVVCNIVLDLAIGFRYIYALHTSLMLSTLTSNPT